MEKKAQREAAGKTIEAAARGRAARKEVGKQKDAATTIAAVHRGKKQRAQDKAAPR